MKRNIDQRNNEPGTGRVPNGKKPKKMTLAQRVENSLGERFDENLWIGCEFYLTSSRWVRQGFQSTVRFKRKKSGKVDIFACKVSREFQPKKSDPVCHVYKTVVVAPDDEDLLDYQRIVCDSKGVHVYFCNQTKMDITEQTTEKRSFPVTTYCD